MKLGTICLYLTGCEDKFKERCFPCVEVEDIVSWANKDVICLQEPLTEQDAADESPTAKPQVDHPQQAT